MLSYRLTRIGTAPDAAAYASSAATFGSAVRNTRNATLVVAHDDEGIKQYVLAPPNKRNPERVAGNAASSVGARAERTDSPPDLDTSCVVRMVADPDTNAARETQAGADPHQVAHYIRDGLSSGYWVAVSLRPPTKTERNVARRWYDHRLGNTATHHSRSGEVLVSSIWAGGPDRSGVDDIINGVVAAMPGFDVEVRARSPWGAPQFAAVSLLLALLGWVGIKGTEPFGSWWAGLPHLSTALYACYAVLALLTVGMFVGVVPCPRNNAKRRIRKGSVPVPRHRLLAARRPRKERLTADGDVRARAFDGDYPVARDAFFVGPSVVLGLVSPHTGESTDAATTKMRQVPTALRTNVGPVLGVSGTTSVHISQSDRFGGVALFGQPGSGKAQALDTPIMVKDKGMVTIADVEVGDEVRHPDGTWTTVTHLHPVEELPLLRVTFDDGQHVDVTHNHLWNALTKHERLFGVPNVNAERAQELTDLAHSTGPHTAASTAQLAELLHIDPHGVVVFAALHGVKPVRHGWWPMSEMLLAAAEPRRLRETHELKAGMSVSPSLHVASVAPTDTRPSRCITVSAPDGMYVVGDAIPTHNSVVITNLFGYDTALRCRARAMRESWTPHVPGDTGAHNTLIAFENKGRDGVAIYQQYAEYFRDSLQVFEVADPSTPAIDMFPDIGSAAQRAAFFVDSMVYAFGDGAIGNRSNATLNQVFTAALLTVPDDIREANRKLTTPLPEDMSVMEIADVLLCSRGEDAGIKLAAAMAERNIANPNPELGEAIQRIDPIYGQKVTPSARRTLVEAPQNKVQQLLKNPSWWSRSRPRKSWDSIISQHSSAVINAGQSVSGNTIDSGLTAIMLSMLTYGLQKAIERNCAGWGAQGKSVSIYADELSLLAGHNNSDVFQWFRNQGRSFGVRTNFATQIPEQLEPTLRTTVTGFTTFLWLGQNDPGVAQVAATDLSADGSEWSIADITNLEPYHGVLRATVNKHRQPSVPIKTLFYGDGRMSEFVTEQDLG